jgi:hypothetical protein
MPSLIGERHRAARKAARRAKRTGMASDYHRLRIRCKRLRYSLEFASGLYDGELKGFVRQMTRLQDALGSMQDAEVAASRLEDITLADEGSLLSRATVFAMGGVAGRYRSEAEHLLGELPELVALLKGKEWRRSRSLMEMYLKEAADRERAAATPSAGSGRARVAGRTRPALSTLATGSSAAATLETLEGPIPGVVDNASDAEPAVDEVSTANDVAGPDPAAKDVLASVPDRSAAEESTTITPIRR